MPRALETVVVSSAARDPDGQELVAVACGVEARV